MERRIKRCKAQFIVAFAIVLLLTFSLESAFASPTDDEKEEKPLPLGLTKSYIDNIRKKLNSKFNFSLRPKKSRANGSGIPTSKIQIGAMSILSYSYNIPVQVCLMK